MSALTMSYEGLVEAGRAAREQADDMQWVEGDLALQVEVLPPTERPRDAETGEFLADEAKALRRYAEDIGLNRSTLLDYRRAAEAWPPSARALGVPWRVHSVLASLEDRFDLIQPGMSVREAERLVRARNAASAGKPNWGELLGRVGDELRSADNHLDKFEQAIGEKTPTEKVRRNAGRYAGWAESLAARLRQIEGRVL